MATWNVLNLPICRTGRVTNTSAHDPAPPNLTIPKPILVGRTAAVQR